ncbi:LacI family DNA-binding transcriptional regulator [Homoserinibacter sp. GY 40078]|uniref:LacI family DNA-binding transcriptional regulator n=1 Tax=Homoserinibacter sp. GY 40078 TaxID=2603275 RepID=UPI0021068C8D|nr:LacI family DNA-binding transcriptional regulator [Homoserinibacter sp. GY 40078]
MTHAFRRAGFPTIADVAEHAEVSPATVSRVMNGRFAGEESVADRVRASATALGYRPSHLARSLALGRTGAIALVVPDLGNPAFQAVLAGLTRAAASDGYRVLVADSTESPGDEPDLASEVRHRCDALVLCAPRMPDDRLAALDAELSPLVLVNRERAGVPSVGIDYAGGIAQLAEHLIGLGHEHLAYVAGPEASVSDRHRRRGLDRVRESNPGVSIHELPGGATTDDGRRAADNVRQTGATAVLAFNDLVAIGLIDGLSALGVRVPDDVSVTGFDDVPFARYTAPALTTAAVPHERLGADAWDRMRALLRGEAPAPDELLPASVVVRASSGPRLRA